MILDSMVPLYHSCSYSLWVYVANTLCKNYCIINCVWADQMLPPMLQIICKPVYKWLFHSQLCSSQPGIKLSVKPSKQHKLLLQSVHPSAVRIMCFILGLSLLCSKIAHCALQHFLNFLPIMLILMLPFQVCIMLTIIKFFIFVHFCIKMIMIGTK